MRKKIVCAVLACLLCACLAATGLTAFAQEEYAMNFAGVTSEEEDGYVYRNYYINENKWLIGTEISRPAYMDGQARDYIQFTDTTDTSVFGPRAKFGDFVCRFSIDMNSILGETGAAIGLSFNRSQLYTAPANADGIYFMKTEEGTVVRSMSGSMDVATAGRFWLQYEEEDAVDLWEEEGLSLDVMVIKSGDTARLYFAPEGEEAALRVCRAVIEGVEGYGYVAVSGYAGATFRLDSMAVTPLSLAEGFTAAYTYTRAAQAAGDAAVVGHGGSVLTQQAYSDVYLFAEVQAAAGSSFLLRFGDTFVNFASDGTVSGKGLLLVSGGTADFAAFREGACVRVFAAGGDVRVEVDAGEGFVQVARFTALTAVGTGSAGVEAGADASLVVKQLGAVTLEGVIEIAAHDYDPVEDMDPIHEKEISFNEYYGLTGEEE